MGVERYVLKPEEGFLPLYRLEVVDSRIIVVNYFDMYDGAEYRLVEGDGEHSIYSKISTQPSASPSLLTAAETLGSLVSNGDDDLEETDRLYRGGFRLIELEDIPYDVVRNAFEPGMTIDCLCREYSLIEHTPDT
jgi:hypothetical protein